MITFTTNGSLVDIKDGFTVIRSINSNSKNITWSYGSDVSRIDFAVDDLTFDSIPANQISFDGVALSDATGFKAAVEAMFPNLAGGSGGSSYLVKAEVTLTNAQIKALPTTPVEIVAAQGSGKVIVPVIATAYINTSGGAYTGVTDASIVLIDNNSDYLSSVTKIQSPLGSPAANFIIIPCPYMSTGSATFSGITISDQNFSLPDNQSLSIKDDWGGLSNYGGGNAANTLKVTVYYLVVDL